MSVPSFPTPKNHHYVWGNPDQAELHKGLSTTRMRSWWWVLLPLTDYLWWSEGGRRLLGHCFPTMTSTLTEAIELLRPFLVANSFRTASQLHLDHHCWLGSLILLPELSALDKDESTTIMHPQLLSGAKAFCILGPIWNLLKVLNSAKKKSTFSPGIYPPWEVTILLSLILTSFCHIWNVKVQHACYLNRLRYLIFW